MREYVVCLATTGWIQKEGRNIRLSEGALEDQKRRINNETHIPFGFEHNPMLMPIGRTDSAWLERTEDKTSLMAKCLVHSDVDGQRHSRSGTNIANLQFGSSNKGFASNRDNEDDGDIIIAVDPSDFENRESLDRFVQKVTNEDRTVRVRNYERNSVDPYGVILIAMGAWVFRRLEKFARHVIDETLRKVGDKVSDKLSNWILETTGVFEQTASKKMEKYHVVMKFPGRPKLVLVSERLVGEIGGEVDKLHLTEIDDLLARYEDLFSEAQEITLIRKQKGEWKFQHIKTRDGNIIGDWECYQDSVKRWTQLKEAHGEVPVSPAGTSDD